MKKTILLLCITFLYYHSFSQKNYQPATIVTSNGESITGEIDYKNWKENPSTISFRKNKSSESKIYGVEDLQSFSVSNDIYKRAILDIVERKDDISHLSEGDSMPVRTDTVFLLSVVTGPKSLYSYTDNVNHFYISNGEGYEWLTFKRYKVKTEVLNPSAYYSATSDNYVATNKGYISQLKTYLNECAGLSLSENLTYDLKSLRKVFISYYNCLGTDPAYVQKAENEKLEIGVMAGVSNTTFNINTASKNILGRIDFSPSVNFTAGAFFDIVFPRQRRRTSLINELMYSEYQTKGEYREVINSSRYYDYTYNFEYSYVKLNTMLRYKFFANSTIIFINGGVSNGIVLNDVNTLTKVHTFSSNKTTTTSPGYDLTRTHELGFIAGAGVRRNRAAVELRAEKGLGPFRSSGYRASVIRYFGLISYRIW